MSGAEALVVGPVIDAAKTVIVDSVVQQIKRRMRYMFCLGDFVKGLRDQKQTLSSELTQLNLKVQEAESRVEDIVDDVVKWRKDAGTFLDEVENLDTKIKKEVKCLKCWPNWIWRYGLSKEIEAKTEDIKKHVDMSKFERVGRPAPLPGIGLHTEGFMDSKSSILAEKEIMEALEDSKVNMIGVWGMGGLGKTTLVKKVAYQLNQSHCTFDYVVMAVVSQTPEIGKIQSKIADVLDLKLDKETDDGKAEQLCVGINKKKRVLIILDDVWKELRLEEIGIPVGEDNLGCKVILTTRIKQVCSLMECQRIVTLGVLDGNEAWDLFKMNADHDNASHNNEIVNVAKEIVEECGGLPIALVTLAKALRDKSDINGWELARNKLKSARFMAIESIPREESKNAYMSLKISYDYLKSDTTKRCFLMCALYPEDYSIDVEELVTYAWALRLYQRAGSIEEVRKEVLEAVENLKNRCLLLEDEERHVKLHDMVRDVALWIASKEESGFIINFNLGLGDQGFEACSAISISDNLPNKFPKDLVCRKLEILLLDSSVACDMLIACFERMQGLKVLSLTSGEGIFSLTALSSLTELRTLRLEGFERLENFSSLTKLKKLEILRLCCFEIQGVVDELEKLTNLRVLYLSGCRFLSRFSPNLFGKLRQLEELYLIGLETKMKLDDILMELKFLRTLAVLSLDLPNYQGFPNGFVFPRLKRYEIDLVERIYHQVTPSSTRQSLRASGTLPLVVISELLWSMERLDVSRMADERIAFLTDQIQQHVPVEKILQNLKEVRINNCENLKVVFPTQQHLRLEHLVELFLSDCPRLVSLFSHSLAQSLTHLEKLKIRNCPELEQIVIEMDGTDEEISSNLGSSRSSFCFPKLTVVEIEKCGGLEYLFPELMAPQGLPQLRELCITDCDQLTQLVKSPSKEREEKVHLTSLSRFVVSNCPRLTESTVHLGVEDASIEDLPLSAFKESLISNIKEAELDRIRLDGMDNLIPNGIADGLNGLTSLQVSTCEGVKCLVDTTKENVPASAIFTSLEKLHLSDMADLIKLCELGDQSPKDFLPNLKSFGATSCREILCISPIAKSQYLQEVWLEDCYTLEEVFKMDELQLVDNSSSTELGNDEAAQPQPQPVLSNLQSLRLKNLFRLRSIIEGPIRNVSLRSLKVIEVVRCSELKFLFSASLVQTLELLEELEIRHCSGLEAVFLEQDESDINETKPNSSFGLPNLKTLRVSGCERLEYLLPSPRARGEELQLPCLKQVILWGLANLSSFGPENSCLVKTPALETLSVRDCPRLTNFSKRIVLKGVDLSTFWKMLCAERSLGDLKSFVPDAARPGGSKGLTFLSLDNCEQLEFLVDTTNLKQQQQDDIIGGAIFSDLKELYIDGMKSLKKLCNPNYGQLPNPKRFLQNLETLWVNHCPQLVSLHPLAVVAQNLNRVEIEYCDGLQGTLFPIDYEMIQENQNQAPPLLLSNLERLEIRGLPRLEWILSGPTNFVNLRCLRAIEIDSCGKLRYVFPVCVVKSLLMLERLEIACCDELESLFPELQGDDVDQETELELEEDFQWLPKLETLKMRDCPALKYVFPTALATSATLPQLISIEIKSCPLIDQLVFKGYNHSVEQCIGLEGLVVDDCPSLPSTATTSHSKQQQPQPQPQFTISRDKWNGPHQFGCKLRELHLIKLNQLTYIFPMVVLTHCPQLSVMEISHCSNLVQVITSDETEIEISSSSRSQLAKKSWAFPQIQELRLGSLPNLERFCPLGYHLEFPYLEKLVVNDCPKMITSFTLDYYKLAVHAQTQENCQLQETQSESPRVQEDIEWDYESGAKGLPPYRNKTRSKGKSPYL